ncbi:serine/threonine-protein phosphatase 4 regulatory subunit 2 [Bradysia coprophila]|uniref:serine/threonine-protein phosphatase 4 regulatory subunit 2 n=1 Tax=Bradysia coprophila TaxID=38358 RepID=UPI00187DC552|nr:serine/threonine-protein phosphatase 4 regulatory subunit 2 [Bradysia coprophila]
MDLENAEEILQILERYTKQKSKTIPDELNGYLSHVAMTGDSVYTWSKVQYFFREKLAHVLKDFHDTTPRTEDLPISRNVDPFNYDTMKTILLERFDLFNAAPFTIQRLSELLSDPKKHYCRLDKFMRALEKNILVVSTVEPGHRTMGSENGDSINGDPLMDINVDVEMDKEPSGSCVTSMDEKETVEAELEPSTDELNTETKTEEGTSEQSDETVTTDDATSSTNGHHSDELNDTIEDVKEEATEDKTDNSSASVEPVKVEVQPAELAESLPEESAAVSEPIVEASPVIPDTEQPKETATEEVDGKVISETDAESSAVATTEAVDDKESVVEKKSEKHALDRDDDDEECQPTAAKLVKIDESSTESTSDTDQLDIAAIDKVPSDEAVISDDDQRPVEVTEPLSEAVLLEENIETTDSVATVLPIVDEPTTTSEAAPVVDEPPTTVDNQTVDDDTAAIPTDAELELDAADDPNNDTASTGNTISSLASTLSNDLDALDEEEEEVDEDALIEPIVADAEQTLLDSPVTLAETDVEMIPSIDGAEQMAVEDTIAPVLASTNVDSAMDATQSIPAADEQMDVLENNSMDQDL